jgi:hypothetical protein
MRAVSRWLRQKLINLVQELLGVDPALNRGNVDAWIKRTLERSSIQNLQGVTAQFVTGV